MAKLLSVANQFNRQVILKKELKLFKNFSFLFRVLFNEVKKDYERHRDDYFYIESRWCI